MNSINCLSYLINSYHLLNYPFTSLWVIKEWKTDIFSARKNNHYSSTLFETLGHCQKYTVNDGNFAICKSHPFHNHLRGSFLLDSVFSMKINLIRPKTSLRGRCHCQRMNIQNHNHYTQIFSDTISVITKLHIWTTRCFHAWKWDEELDQFCQ